MSETPDVPPNSNNVADDKCSKNQKDSSSPSQLEEGQEKGCCEYGHPITKEHKVPAADASDIAIGNKQGQDHRGCRVAQHGSCHQTHELPLLNEELPSQQPAGDGNKVKGGDITCQHSPTVTSIKDSEQRHISSDQRRTSKDNHPNDQERRGSSHTHPQGTHSSDNGRPRVLFSGENQGQEGRKTSRTSDHKERQVPGTSQGDKEGRRPSRTSQDKDGRRTSKGSVPSDKEGRRTSRTSEGNDSRRKMSGTSHHGRKVSGVGHEHGRRISAAAEAGSGLEVMADLGHSKDKPHHHAANEFKKGGWDRLNAL